jgi:hypothetical protein
LASGFVAHAGIVPREPRRARGGELNLIEVTNNSNSPKSRHRKGNRMRRTDCDRSCCLLGLVSKNAGRGQPPHTPEVAGKSSRRHGCHRARESLAFRIPSN